jgi:hypothetical protein
VGNKMLIGVELTSSNGIGRAEGIQPYMALKRYLEMDEEV